MQTVNSARTPPAELDVSALGLGYMGVSEFYAGRDDAKSVATIQLAIDRGVTHFDTADMYGVGKNEELLGQAIKGRRAGLIIATKFGNMRSAEGGFSASTASLTMCRRRRKLRSSG